MQKKTLNNSDLEVSTLGLGCMGLIFGYEKPAEKSEAVKLLSTAYEQGTTPFDTAKADGAFSNEEILGEAVAPFRNNVVVATNSENVLILVEKELNKSQTENIK